MCFPDKTRIYLQMIGKTQNTVLTVPLLNAQEIKLIPHQLLLIFPFLRNLEDCACPNPLAFP